MMTVATVYYQGVNVPSFSRCYTPQWVDRLYRGVARHAPEPFRFVCLTDDKYAFAEPIEQQPLLTRAWSLACKQLYGIEADRLLLCGLDTVIVGDLTDLWAYRGDLAVPRDPYHPDQPCNGVVLCPSRPDIGQAPGDDMRVLDAFRLDYLDDLFPGQVKSYKVHVQPYGLGDARIVYFHGVPKMDALPSEHPVRQAWMQ